MIYHIYRRCYAAAVFLIVLGPGPVHDQSPGGAVGAPVPAVGDHQPPLPTGVLTPEVSAHQGPGAEIGKTYGAHILIIQFFTP